MNPAAQRRVAAAVICFGALVVGVTMVIMGKDTITIELSVPLRIRTDEVRKDFRPAVDELIWIGWWNRRIVFAWNRQELAVESAECQIQFCPDCGELHILTCYSHKMTLADVQRVYAQMCVMRGSGDAIRFSAWRRRRDAHDTPYLERWASERGDVWMEVLTSFNDVRPWFVSIEAFWPCHCSRDNLRRTGKPEPVEPSEKDRHNP